MLKNQEYLDFIRYSVEGQDDVPESFNRIDWEKFFKFCYNHSILGVVFSGLERANKRIPQSLLFEWIGAVENLKAQNKTVNKRILSITKWFNEKKHRCVILKGQANALMYPNPQLRSPGDIDIWVEGETTDLIKLVLSECPNAHYSIHHVKMPVFNDVSVEVHYRPVYLSNWFKDNLLQRYIREKEEQQFSHKERFCDAAIGTVTDEFNIVFQMLHMYNHFFSSRNNFKQFIDYYYLLNKDLPEDKRKECADVLENIGVKKYASGMMWIMKELLGVENERLILEPNEKIGRLILNESYNTGTYSTENNLKYVIEQFIANFRIVHQFPKEVLINPLFLVWHQWWKLKMKMALRKEVLHER